MRGLTQRARQLAALQQHYQRATPPSLAGASRVIGFEQRVLTIGADNSAIAAKLRHLAPQILFQLQENGSEVTGIRVKVQVNPERARRHSAHVLSDAGRQQLADFSATIKDSPLKRALQRLTKR